MTDVPLSTRSVPGSLSPADWAQLEATVDALLDAPPERRGTMLAEMSGGDPARRAQLERLVAECERPHPLLDQPAARRFAALVDEQAVRVSAVLGDRYHIRREIGRGGMATVYLAHDIRHSRDVAVKILRPDLAAALGGGRFLREIEIAARLRHPNIVPLYDSGWVPATRTEGDQHDGGVLYYVMPYEAGHSLRERLARDGQLSVDDTVVILRDVCDALAHAHRHGIVHRDVKPDNVLLAGRHAMVTDFGVAKALTAEIGHTGDDDRRDALTTAGVSLGTPAYMAPEQIAADPRIDHRADLYAVGVVAYELLAGRPPFQSDEPQAVLASHLTQVPEPIAKLRPDVPPPLAELVTKCLEKRPSDRWQTADELVSRLESMLSPNAISGDKAVVPAPVVDQSAPASATAGSRWWLVGAVAAVVTASAVFAINRLRDSVNQSLPLDPNKIVVVPFRVLGVDSSLRDVGEGVVDLLSAKLPGEGGPLAVDSRTAISAWNRVTAGRDGTADHARRVALMVGAGEALSGTMVRLAGNQLTITATVIPARGTSAHPGVTVTGDIDSLSTLLDTVATRTIARHAGVSEQTLSTLTTSNPALRSYLWGRSESRHGREAQAVEHFSRALELDSTFALAALDLVVASGPPLGVSPRCPRNDCFISYFTVGFPNPVQSSDHAQIWRALQLAWWRRDKLSPRDRALLEALRGDNTPNGHTARVMIAALHRAAAVSPARAETHYLLGSLLLFQGPAVEAVDSRARAAAAFRSALQIDSEYVAPLAGLVELAALEPDSIELRRTAVRYLARDSVGGGADYVRWRVAAELNDAKALSSIRSHFDAFDKPTLHRIVHASLMSGLDLGDAVRAVTLAVNRASERRERRIALGTAYMLALNRGRPREAAELMRRRAMEADDTLSAMTWETMAALFWDGDTTSASLAANARVAMIERDTLPRGRLRLSASTSDVPRQVTQQAFWHLLHGDTARAAAALRWLRQSDHVLGADFVDLLFAPRARQPHAATILARIDSIAREGCCTGVIVHWVNMILVRAYEDAGRDADALRAARRGVWRLAPQLLSTFVREEGRLAAKLGDREAAIRAYRHYLALRSDPEPELLPEINRVRAELARLEQGR